MTPATLAGVPNAPGTPRRTIRVPNDLWDAAHAKAVEEGTDLSTVLRDALNRYLRAKPKPPSPPSVQKWSAER